MDPKILQQLWQQKLKDSGFEDIEDSKGRLKQYDRRTQAFDNRDMVLEFYSRLDEFLNTCQTLDATHRRILELYSDGVHNTVIQTQIGLSRARIQQILRMYRLKIMGMMK